MIFFMGKDSKKLLLIPTFLIEHNKCKEVLELVKFRTGGKDKDFVKAKMTKRQTDYWNEDAIISSERDESRLEEFVKDFGPRAEGISADKEKFIHGLNTVSHKVLPPNKRDKV